MLQFMGDNKRLLHFHEQKLSDLEAFKSNNQVFQKNTSASLKNLETQVWQLALSMTNQSKGTFPSDTQKNPKDCMAVQLRSGKEVDQAKVSIIKNLMPPTIVKEIRSFFRTCWFIQKIYQRLLKNC